MTNELAKVDDSSLELLPPAQPVSHTAVAMLAQHASAMQTAYDLASRLVVTEMVPARYKNKAEDATAAILYGAELGLNPIQALQNVFSVNGSPAIFARTMKALLRSRGYRFRTVEKTNQAVEVHGWSPGRNPDTTDPDEKARWTIEDAQLAKYTTNKKYETEPRAMLIAKATAEVCRNLAPDVLLGIAYSVEDLELDRPPVSQPVSSRSAPLKVEDIFAEPQPAAQAQLDADSDESVAEPAVPEPAVAVPDEPPTAAMNRKMHALFREAGLSDHDDRLTVASAILGYRLDTSANLSKSEAMRIIETLDGWQQHHELEREVNEILNRAAIAAENQSLKEEEN